MPRLEFRCRLIYESGFHVDAAFDSDAPVTALCGPSGSGKTSVLSMIAGLRRPDSGFIRLGDRVLFDSAAGVHLPPERRGVGYVFQNHLLFPHLDVRGNLLYGWRRRRGRPARADLDKVTRVLELGDLLGRMPAGLSGGERQRVALGRALLCAPALLLLDEPLASVDQDLKGRVLDYIERALADWSIPTLYVSHDPGEIARIAGRVIRLDGGHVSA